MVAMQALIAISVAGSAIHVSMAMTIQAPVAL
jgi:hypothetical protein